VLIASSQFSTKVGDQKNVLNKLEDLRRISSLDSNRFIDRELYKTFILNRDVYYTAYENIKSKPGSMTPGIKPDTLDGISPTVIDDILSRLKSEVFQFTPGRRLQIPKASGGTRPLTVGNPRDKVVQEVIRMVLEAIYEPCFVPQSHGFRPGKSCHTALRSIFTTFTGCT
jgi:retron-type reverse transcriptase